MATQTDKVFEPLAHSEDMLASLLPRGRSSAPQGPAASLVSAPLVATLADFDPEGRPVIHADALVSGERLVARTTVALEREQAGSSVVVLCENGDPRLPIIVGVIETQVPAAKTDSQPRTVVHADDERYVIDARREIVLRCGASSITLTRAGKVIIKGTYVLSRSSGYNKIKGAAVDIN